jgi:hypothetical protein
VLLQSIADELRCLLPDIETRIVLPPHSLQSTTAIDTNRVFPTELGVLRGHSTLVNHCLVYSLCKLWMQDDVVLNARLRMWQREFNNFKPDLVVADYAPSLSMAARGKVPCFVVGSGHTLPPPERETCLSQYNSHESEDVSAELEWLDKINSVLHHNGITKLNFLPEVNRGDSYGLFTIPLFDVYWQDRQQKYLGVYHPGGSPQPSIENDGTALAYVSMSNDNASIIEGIIESQIPTVAFFGQLSSRLADRVKGTNIQLVEKPFHLARDLPGRALAVHAGSLGMSAAGVYAGIPQVGLYQHDEGENNCRSFDIAQIGLSAWAKKATPQQISDMMHTAKASTQMRLYATALSQRYSTFRDENPIARAMPLAVGLLN